VLRGTQLKRSIFRVCLIGSSNPAVASASYDDTINFYIDDLRTGSVLPLSKATSPLSGLSCGLHVAAIWPLHQTIGQVRV